MSSIEVTENIMNVGGRINSEYGRVMCQTLYAASVISHECYVTEECPIVREGYRIMWLTFAEAGDELFQDLCDERPIIDTIERLITISLDAYLLERRMIHPSSLEIIWRSRPQKSILDGKFKLKVATRKNGMCT